MGLAIGIIIFLVLFLPESMLLWFAIIFGVITFLSISMLDRQEKERTGARPTIRYLDGKNQDIRVYIETRIESMYAAGKTDIDVAHTFNFFYEPMWLFYHPFMVYDPDLLRISDQHWPHKQADAFRERMHRKYPQAYSHSYDASNHAPEIEAEFQRFSRQYLSNRYGIDSPTSPLSSSVHRTASAREKSAAWTMVTHDPILGHALGHDDRQKKN